MFHRTKQAIATATTTATTSKPPFSSSSQQLHPTFIPFALRPMRSQRFFTTTTYSTTTREMYHIDRSFVLSSSHFPNSSAYLFHFRKRAVAGISTTTTTTSSSGSFEIKDDFKTPPPPPSSSINRRQQQQVDMIRTIGNRAKEISKFAKQHQNSSSDRDTLDDMERKRTACHRAIHTAEELLCMTSSSSNNANFTMNVRMKDEMTSIHAAILSVTSWLLDCVDSIRDEDEQQQYPLSNANHTTTTELRKPIQQKLIDTAIQLSLHAESSLHMPIHRFLYSKLLTAVVSASSSHSNNSPLLLDCLYTILASYHTAFFDDGAAIRPTTTRLEDDDEDDAIFSPALLALLRKKRYRTAIELLHHLNQRYEYELGYDTAVRCLTEMKKQTEQEIRSTNDGDVVVQLTNTMMGTCYSPVDAIELIHLLQKPIDDVKDRLNADMAEIKKELPSVFGLLGLILEEYEVNVVSDDGDDEDNCDDDDEDSLVEEEEEEEDDDDLSDLSDLSDLMDDFQTLSNDIPDGIRDSAIQSSNASRNVLRDKAALVLEQPLLSASITTPPSSSLQQNDTTTTAIVPPFRQHSKSGSINTIYNNRNGHSWMIPDVTSQLRDWNGGNDLLFTKEYEDRLLLQGMKEDEEF